MVDTGLSGDDGVVGMDAGVESEHRFETASDGLFAASIALAQVGKDLAPAVALAADWASRECSANPDSSRRYPWPVGSLYTRHSPYAPPPDQWRAWHPSEERVRTDDPGRFERQLLLPPIVADSCELLEIVAAAGHNEARHVLDRTLPVMRRDVARNALGSHAWSDTWALWNLTRRPRALRRLHPFALAIADTYAARAIVRGGIAVGSRFPFHDQPMVSVSAQLAAGLLALGIHPRLIGQLAAWVVSRQAPNGAFADADEPPDPLTTLAAADLLLGLDPEWDPIAAIGWLDGQRRMDGTLVAFGPEVAWLTLAVDDLAGRARWPFAGRFRWPQLAVEQRDRRTGLPFLGYVADLARLFAEIPSLAHAPVEMAFLDLAGFGAWNDRYGMARGDEVLRFLASELRAIPDAVAIRDGGDEFVVVGAPTRDGMAETMTAFREAFPRRYVQEFGIDAPPVAIRVVTTTSIGSQLVATRDVLGIEISALKRSHPSPPPEGVSAVLGKKPAPGSVAAWRGAAEQPARGRTDSSPARGRNGSQPARPRSAGQRAKGGAAPTTARRPRTYLVRHGETDWNAAGRLLSRTDEPLSATGERQAVRLAEMLAPVRWDRALASPMIRARRTCEILLDGCCDAPAIEVDERLVELDFGPYEGWTEGELLADPATRRWRHDGTEVAGIETIASVQARARLFLSEMDEAGGTTLIVGHGRMLRILLATILDLPLEFAASLRMRNCRPAIVEPGARPLLLGFNVGDPADEVRGS